MYTVSKKKLYSIILRSLHWNNVNVNVSKLMLMWNNVLMLMWFFNVVFDIIMCEKNHCFFFNLFFNLFLEILGEKKNKKVKKKVKKKLNSKTRLNQVEPGLNQVWTRFKNSNISTQNLKNQVLTRTRFEPGSQTQILRIRIWKTRI